MKIEMVCCESVLLREIADKRSRQRDVAQTYRLALESSEGSTLDWGRVNAAIIERWSLSGLLRIKTLAYNGKCFSSPA